MRITDLRFDNKTLRTLGLDPTEFDTESRTVRNAVFARTYLQPVKVPKVVAWSSDALALIGIDPSQYKRESDLEHDIETYLSGNVIIPESGCEPYAHCYSGHQFGSFAGQLGDGAAMYLGEVAVNGGSSTSKSSDKLETACVDEKNDLRLELALKGSGKTPFSRSSDGRKVLRSSIREFLGSEALHFLGIPSTRSGSCVTSSSVVQRDPFYDGRVIDEACTIITRIAPTFLRFGSFEIFKRKEGTSSYDREGPSVGNSDLRKKMLDHVISYFPNEVKNIETESARYQEYMRETVRLSALLTVKWDTCGFVHGVLNTDNMSVLGLTIDYGPFAFLDHFDSTFTPNGSDGTGRYTYQKQSQMVKWNLLKLFLADDKEESFASSEELWGSIPRVYPNFSKRLVEEIKEMKVRYKVIF